MTAPVDTEKLQRAARAWYDSDCCVVPAAADGTKRPFGQWETYQHKRPAWPVVQAWLNTGNYDGIGLICGAVSGNLEMFEIEGRASELYDQLGMRMVEHGYADLWLRICTGYLERTPSGGYHWLMRVESEPRRNVKLAQRPSTDDELAAWKTAERAKAETDYAEDPAMKIKRFKRIEASGPADVPQVLIETRGEGGFTIVAPSGGRTHPLGDSWEWIAGSPASIPLITAAERDALHAIANTFDLMPAKQTYEPGERRERNPDDPLRPGDDYNLRADWHDILEPEGWTFVGHLGAAKTWCRPGKGEGISATTGRNDGDNLYVFSSSVAVFDTEKPYSKFHAYAALHHNGDFKAAARDLGRQGYGEQRTKPPPVDITSLPSDTTDRPAIEPHAKPGVVAISDSADDAFWTARPVLEHIRTFAQSRRCSPYALLGVSLVRVVVAIPPWVTLPALVGSQASLNLFIALVGPSGSGKGAAESAAGDCLDVRLLKDGDALKTATVGSGEGIGHLYAHRESKGVVRDRDAVIFTVPEVDNLTALGQRQGATLMPQLRSAWSGETLGFAYADPKKALSIDRHTYRMGLILGVQPGRAGSLLDDADGGTPQRFLWMPVGDPKAPAVAPSTPPKRDWGIDGAVQWTATALDANGVPLVEIPIPDSVRLEVGMASLSRLRGQDAALDGHAMLAKLKAAAAFALLDGRRAVNEEDWQLAAHLMAVSDATRASVQQHLSEKFRTSNAARGEAEGERAVLVAETVAAAAAQRVARRIVAALRDGELPRSGVSQRIAARDRAYLDDALERLEIAGQVVRETREKGVFLRLA